MQYERRELGLGTWVLWNLEYWLVLHKIGHDNNTLEKEISATINLSNKIIKVVNFRVNNLDWAFNFGGSSLADKEKNSFLTTHSFHSSVHVLGGKKVYKKEKLAV